MDTKGIPIPLHTTYKLEKLFWLILDKTDKINIFLHTKYINLYRNQLMSILT